MKVACTVWTGGKAGRIKVIFRLALNSNAYLSVSYGVVIIPVIRAHAIMLKRNLIYTAITRAKQKVILIGQFPMLYMAIGRDEASKRNTLLGERISNYVKAFTTKEANLKKAS